jgi:hypothetical protein
MKFRKKPVVIEAERYDGTIKSIERILNIRDINLVDLNLGYRLEIKNHSEGIYIKTLKEEIKVNIGDWVIRDAKGELYSCNPYMFDVTYEPVRRSERRTK